MNRAIRKMAPLTCLLSLCGGAGSAADVGPLADTAWRLVEFQSMDDAIGAQRPRDPALYTMRLHADGRVTMRLDCNRAKGSWRVSGVSLGDIRPSNSIRQRTRSDR